MTITISWKFYFLDLVDATGVHDVEFDEKTQSESELQTLGDPTKNVRITFHPMREEAIYRMGLDVLEARK